LGNNVAGTYSGPTILHYEPVDPSLFVRPKSFSVKGKVFAAIMNETAQSTARVPDNAVVNCTTASINRVEYSNNYVYTHVCRFVIVRQKNEFCYACPIFTYGKRATKKPGVRVEEHGIIYSEGQRPQLISGESGITKASIGVVMAHGQTDLQIESRIYYGIHHPIQYHLKVKEIGQVVHSHLPKLIGNWEEDDKETRQERTVIAAAKNKPEYDSKVVQEKTGNELSKDFDDDNDYFIGRDKAGSLPETRDYAHTSIQRTRPSHTYQEPHQPDQHDEFSTNSHENCLAQPSMMKTV
jgi:hypothetical protein